MPETAEMPEIESEAIPIEDISAEEAEFIAKRDSIAEALKDEETFRKCIAEIYIFMSNMDTAIRSIGAMGGPKAILKMMMGGKNDG